ncbi:enoyl-CoA hydratase/isomerase family protein [Ferroacidibacillus organovorans]|uniref:Enoyl-CoA hydratase n=1 Tax=Ferroacidibacillus organovorans TaxID=1765683 RepID=A0A117SX68_9BACL|nr:enoyl-CoA hydratase-related protein [Ferroacidibacillus organovorans]KUO94803.1 enoyl-CoA hydratase [Ferroacidibacillus organovorans]
MEELKIAQIDGVRVITLNRPERLNALHEALADELVKALADASRDDEVRVVVLTGAGRGFCAGLDLTSQSLEKESQRSRAVQLDPLGWVGRQALAVTACDKPVIAAMNGIAAGAGLALALACDLRYIAEDATLTTGYIRRGLSPDAGVTYFLPRLCGMADATELIMTGRTVTADEANALRIVNRVFARATFQEEVMKIARELAAGPPLALTHSKRLLAGTYDHSLADQLKLEWTAIHQCFASEDVREGIQSFLEKRAPQFTGK